jgi:hypothetical protein
MSAQSDTDHERERVKRWVKPLLEEVVLEPTDDVLGICWKGSSPAPVPGACSLVLNCAY